MTSAWEMAKNAGPFGVMLMLWLFLRVDTERKELAKQLLETTKNLQQMNEVWLKLLTSKDEHAK
ncbi:MAG TPA: hypothetical protein VEP90_25605 [Methylomirabilota bacterium]|nr:hypothetical protein [Methylomirabilota bacterium]